MTWYPIAYIPPQYEDSSGNPYSGAVLKAYREGTTTVINMATSYTGGTTATSFALNASGYPVSGGSVIIPHVEENYKLSLYPTQAAADANSGAIWTYDNIQITSGTNLSRFIGYADDTGAANAYVLAPDPAISAYNEGDTVTFSPDNNNTGASTIVISGLSAKDIKLSDGNALYALAMITTGMYTLIYNGTYFVIQNPERQVKPSHFTGKILYGATLSNNGSDATNDIDIAAGSVVSDDGTVVMAITAITKRLDAAWAVGTAQGGLDTGAIANATYFVWAIHRPDTGVTDVLFSTSASSPTMPSSYTKKARIGAIIRESAAIVPFLQYGKEFWRQTPLQFHNTTTSTSAATVDLLYVPNGIKVQAICSANIDAPSTGTVTLFSDLSAPDVAPAMATGILSVASGNSGGGGVFRVVTNTARSARVRSDVGSRNIDAAVLGWVDYQL